MVKITKDIRIIDLQKPLRRACNGIVIKQFREDYSELLVHLYFESEINIMMRFVFINKSQMTIIISYYQFKAQRNKESK